MRVLLLFICLTVSQFDVKENRSLPKELRNSPPRVVFLGDSLTAGFGLDPESAYPALIQERATEEKRNVRVVNAGVSGDTTAGGLRRLDWLLKEPIDLLVIALGANDGLRGLSPEMTRSNLQQIARKARERSPGVRLVLAGMKMPPNLGQEYTEKFAAIYPALAAEEGMTLIPFLLEGVVGESTLNQADGIHPTAEGQRIIAEHVWTAIRPLLEE